MGRFDLNTPVDFARLTSSLTSQLLGAFGKDPKMWAIEEASYNGIVFHVFKSTQTYQGALSSIVDQGGRRKVKYLYPYVDGQALDDLGARPEQFDLEVVLFGSRYKEILIRLMSELNKPQAGTLDHPVRGKITCAMETYSLRHSNEMRNAASLTLTMIQQTFTISSYGTVASDNSLKGALSRALGAFKKISSAIDKVNASIIATQSAKAFLTSAIEEYKSLYARTLGRINQSFNAGTSIDIPTLLPTYLGGLATTIYASVVSPNDPFASIPVSEITAPIQKPLDTQEAQKEVNSVRDSAGSVIADMEDMGGGLGSLEFHDNIVDIKSTAIDMQSALEKAVASSNAVVTDYTVRILMSIREVAFAVGINVDRVNEIELLNPELQSVNWIPKGSTLKVPVA